MNFPNDGQLRAMLARRHAKRTSVDRCKKYCPELARAIRLKEVNINTKMNGYGGLY